LLDNFSFLQRVARVPHIQNLHAYLAAQVDGYDGRDHVRRVLDAIEAVIENRATIDQQHYQINNRSLTRILVPAALESVIHEGKAECGLRQL
jgi:hypothetical protein